MNDEEIKKENIELDELKGSISYKGDNEIRDDFEDVTFVESTEDGDALPTKDILKKLREEIKTLRKEKEEYLTGWQRAKADYVNLNKELESHHHSSSILAKEKFVRNLLPALDSFDMAFANKDAWDKVDTNWRMGVEYIYQQLMTGLLDSGVEKIDQTGIVFDPLIHESIESIQTDNKEKNHTIERVIQAGYKIKHRIIRPARVNIYEYKTE